MTQSKWTCSWKFFGSLLIIGVAVAFSDNYAIAQITPDATLGAESSVVTPNGDIRDFPAQLIDGGALRGTNLFHSFQEFNVGEGLRVYFASPVGVENILSRVTGIDPSDIRGTLGVDGSANLFLLNPNGIIFGSNASLDVSGSFVASTANSLVFDNGVEFSANNPEAPPLLTINVPLGLQYGSNQPGSIVNAGNLAVGSKQNLTLVGGTVATTGQLSAPGGQVTVAAVPGVSLVQLGQAGEFLSVSPSSNLQPTAPDALSLTELLNTIEYDTRLTVANGSQVELMGSGLQVPVDVGTTLVSGSLNASNPALQQTGGKVQVLGDNVGMFDFARIDVSGDGGGGTALIGGDYRGQGEVYNATATYISPDTTINSDAINAGDGGLIVVWANESTRAYGALTARGGAQAGNGGLIEISSPNFLDVSGVAVDASAPLGLGGTWLLDPRNVILSYTATSNGTFEGGNPSIFTPTGDDAVVFIPDIENQLNLGTNVTIATGSTGTQEGNITADGFGITKTTESPVTLTLQAANNIALSNFGLNSNSGPLNIVLQADSDRSGSGDVIVRNAGIQTRGGQFLATAAGSVSLSNLGIDSDYSGNGDAGAISLNAASILIKEAGINSRTSSNGNSGQIIVNSGSLTLQEAGINSSTSDIGNAGSITVNADTVLIEGLVNGSGIGSTTSGRGNAGAVTVIADSVTLRNRAGISSNAENNSQGNAGKVTVNAGSIFVENNSGFGSDTRGSGNGGEIELTADSISFINNSGAGSNTYSSGNGGLINIEAGSLSLDNSGINSNTLGEGDAGEIEIEAGSVLVANQSGLTTSTSSEGDAGEIRITADSVSLRNFSGINSDTEATGNAGKITIDAGSLLLENNTGVTTRTERNSEGNAGEISITADSVVMEKDTAIDSETNGSGDGGIITIDAANSISLRNDSDIFSNTNAQGDAGRVELTASSVLFENESGLGSITRGSGDAGEIRITADSLTITGNSGPATNTEGEGNAGRITIDAGSVLLDNRSSIISNAEPESRGDAGEIILTADSVSLSNFSAIVTNARGEGEAGQITLNSGSVLVENNSVIGSSTVSDKDAGEIAIDADSVSLRNFSRINTNTSGGGNAGQIAIDADSVVLEDNAGVSSRTEANSQGDAGQISITADSVVLEKDSAIDSSTSGSGAAGQIALTVDSVSLSNSLISTTVNADAIVNSQAAEQGGDIDIRTRLLSLSNAAQVSASTSGQGNAGSISVQDANLVSLSNSSISTAVNPGAVGQGGAIEIESQSLSLTNQSALEARSLGEGNAGTIQVNIGDAVTLSNQSQITVSKEGTQGEAGDIQVSAHSVLLDSGSNIIAETDSGEGGDISLLVQDLLVLRDGSRISTEAGTAQAGGDGGNITIDAEFILALPQENSDIIANAFEGRGGKINITTQGIFGIEFRANLTPLSDITASSTFGIDGEVEINRPDVDPSRGLAELPTDFVNAQGLIDRSCTPAGRAAQNSSFTVTGRGGLPSNPTDPLSDDTVWSDLRMFTPQAENLPSSASDADPNQSTTKQIVEAQGWIVNPNGNVILTAKAHPAIQQSPWLMSPACQDVRAVTD